MADRQQLSAADSRTTVSECRTLSISELAAESDLTPGAGGVVTWTRGETHQASLSWLVVRSGEADTALRFFYSVTRPGSESPTTIDLLAPIEYTPCTFGGRRPWFRCPGDGCDERIGKLYLPPQAEEFRCRHCHDLTYESCQRSGTIGYEAFAKTAKRKRQIQQELEDNPLDLRLLRELSNARRDHWEALDRFAKQYTSGIELPSYEERYNENLQNAFSETLFAIEHHRSRIESIRNIIKI